MNEVMDKTYEFIDELDNSDIIRNIEIYKNKIENNSELKKLINKGNSTSYNFKLVQCDVEISSIDKITVSVRGIPSDGGVLKVIVFALTVSELGPQGNDDTAEGVTERGYLENTGESSSQITGVTPTDRKNS